MQRGLLGTLSLLTHTPPFHPLQRSGHTMTHLLAFASRTANLLSSQNNVCKCALPFSKFVHPVPFLSYCHAILYCPYRHLCPTNMRCSVEKPVLVLQIAPTQSITENTPTVQLLRTQGECLPNYIILPLDFAADMLRRLCYENCCDRVPRGPPLCLCLVSPAPFHLVVR